MPTPSRPQPNVSNEFIYPPGTRARYRSAVDSFYAAHPVRQPAPNKRALIERHLDLAWAKYDESIAGSRIRIFQPNPLADPEFLQTRLEALPAAPVTGLGQPRTVDLGRIRYHLTAGPYPYRAGEGYVDFAARQIGGGVLGRGFVQEEIAILETTFLPWVAAVQGRPYPGTRFAPGISLRSLDQQPAVIGLRRFLEVVHPDEVYGRNLESVHPFDPGRYLRPLPAPMDIYLTAMAARNFRAAGAGATYAQADITAMTLLAARAFYDTFQAQFQEGRPLAVHTGNWGTGAFGNSRRTMWAIQRVAVEAAYLRFAGTTGQTPPLDYHFDAYDAQGATAADQAWNGLAGIPAGATLEQCAQHIFQLTVADPAWQVGG